MGEAEGPSGRDSCTCLHSGTAARFFRPRDSTLLYTSSSIAQIAQTVPNILMSTRKADMARRAALNTPIDISSPECALLAMQQHTCTYVPNVRIDCKPFWRVFSVSVCLLYEFTLTPIPLQG